MEAPLRDDLHFLTPPPSPEAARAVLPGPAARWFRRRFGDPTEAQRLAWPALAAGHHLLLCAPTGSGKTLAAFLPILGRLLEEPVCTTLRCLYVAPLKALVNDVCKNLRATLLGLRPFLPAGAENVRLGVRTGDTPPGLRRRLRLEPPQVLLTTPESLAVMLSQPFSLAWFADLSWLVVDEVHALAGDKRGADLAVSLERLTALARREPQRVGLSATCAPLAEAARFLVGAGRACSVAHVPSRAPLELHVEPLEDGPRFLDRLLDHVGPEVLGRRTTVIFTNARGLAERLGWALRRRLPELDGQVAVHHSALAPARRRAVERRLKKGGLRAVVSSTSLELGVDLGTVDDVVLVHPPGSVVRLLQRLGRSGHAPHRPRRGLVLTAGTAELLESAVTAAAGRSGQYEPLHVPAHPLDVLCQQLLGMAAQRSWWKDEAWALVRRAYPYRELSREDFDDCLDYLSGRRRDGTDWLPARLRWDGDEFRIRDGRTARLVRRNLGTILADEARPVRLGDGAAVGEVDEPFADRLRPGDRFLLDGRCLEYRRADGTALLVEEVAGQPAVPRWGSDGWPLSRELALRLYELRVRAAEALREGPAALADLLRQDYGLGERAAAALAAYFHRQECLSEVPDAATCLVERVAVGGGTRYDLHTPLNRTGNDALARVLTLRLARERGKAVTSIVADLGLSLGFRGEVDVAADEWRRLLTADSLEADLDAALAPSALLRERFRRVAVTGLMLLRNPPGGRRRVGGPDWAERRLFAQVSGVDPGFVLLRQAVREVRDECCDAAAARRYLEELGRQTVRLRRLTAPSPFAEAWTQPAAGPVEGLETPEDVLRRLHARLLGDPTDARPDGLAAHA